jgi:hypothetical protein
MASRSRAFLVGMLLTIGSLAFLGCSSLLGLGPEAHEDTAWRDGGANAGDGGGDGAVGPAPPPGQACIFERSKFDDGCVFGP